MAEAMTTTTQIVERWPSLCLACLSRITHILRNQPTTGRSVFHASVRKEFGRHIEALTIWLDDIRTLPSGLRPVESRSLARLLSATLKRLTVFVLGDNSLSLSNVIEKR